MKEILTEQDKIFIKESSCKYSTSEMADILGQKRNIIYHFCVKNNLPFKKIKRTKKHFMYDLTGQEYKVLSLIAKGFSDKKISQSLYVELSTVETHKTNIYSKLFIDTLDKNYTPRVLAAIIYYKEVGLYV